MKYALRLIAYLALVILAMACLDPSRLPWWRVVIGLIAYGAALYVVPSWPRRKKP